LALVGRIADLETGLFCFCHGERLYTILRRTPLR
jgi:hypothetical protein